MTLAIRNITKAYPGHLLFDNFSFEFPSNRITSILGPSGCGKTTLLNMLSGNAGFDRGSLEGFNGLISYIFQEPRLLPWMTVRGNVAFPLKELMDNESIERTVSHNLGLVELNEKYALFPHQLSGGMKQRVSIARAFSFPSRLILMDEAFRGLDYKLKRNLMDAFIRLWQESSRTVIAVTHEVDEALYLGHEILVFSRSPVQVTGTFSPPQDPGKRDPESSSMQNLKNEIIRLLSV